MSWKTIAQKTNSLPPGWASADEICVELDCEPAEVPKILAAAIAKGLVEKQTFPHWQEGSRHLLYCVGYRKVTGRPSTPPEPKSPTNAKIIIVKPGKPADELTAAILACHRRHPHLSASRLREYIPKRFRHACTTDQVAALIGK